MHVFDDHIERTVGPKGTMTAHKSESGQFYLFDALGKNSQAG
jgi:hypothetical protein